MIRQTRPPVSAARSEACFAASVTASLSWPWVKLTALTPNAGKVFFDERFPCPPYRGWLISTTSPGRTSVQRTVEIAAMPLENTAAVSPSSHNARRSSSTSRLGLLKRE